MKVIKNNKGIFIALGIIVVLLLVLFLLMKAFFPSGNPYGNRLDGIEKVPFSKKDIEKLEDKMDNNSSVKKASVNLEGRLFNIILTTKKGTKLDDMKDYCVKLLELYSEEELKYYDIQFYLVNDDKKAESYPAIGYHNKKATKISWSN